MPPSRVGTTPKMSGNGLRKMPLMKLEAKKATPLMHK
jgi:hypothetical protein